MKVTLFLDILKHQQFLKGLIFIFMHPYLDEI